MQIGSSIGCIAVSFLYVHATPPAAIGPIVGGIFAGILVLVCLIALVPIVALIVRRKRQKLSTESSENQEDPAGPVYDEITTIGTDTQLDSNSAYGQVRQN